MRFEYDERPYAKFIKYPPSVDRAPRMLQRFLVIEVIRAAAIELT